ncbi:unnamed protein product [Pleuronectes platessa]|uniref:Uncharacterized protein n=1 Tax=Pleuronectes platessa TaxID=8262 RepID=A0A9N7TQZ0_PLEPL|nr:unnamed protein product [Pleuronectes platessa]
MIGCIGFLYYQPTHQLSSRNLVNKAAWPRSQQSHKESIRRSPLSDQSPEINSWVVQLQGSGQSVFRRRPVPGPDGADRSYFTTGLTQPAEQNKAELVARGPEAHCRDQSTELQATERTRRDVTAEKTSSRHRRKL